GRKRTVTAIAHHKKDVVKVAYNRSCVDEDNGKELTCQFSQRCVTYCRRTEAKKLAEPQSNTYHKAFLLDGDAFEKKHSKAALKLSMG
ncbi:hypothetical protein TELCIR_26181, partial [Teladorsagia circumcincta]